MNKVSSFLTSVKSKPVYYEKDNMMSSRRLFFKEQDGYFWIRCSKALLNCLLQREEYKEDVSIKILPDKLTTFHAKLRLHQEFGLGGIQSWDDHKKDMFSSIMAFAECLSQMNSSLSPVEDVTYTSLVEKPVAYLCSIQDRWVILRMISDKWYFLDPRESVKPITDTYLHLLINQLIYDRGLIFFISGGEFSQLSNQSNSKIQGFGNASVNQNNNAGTSRTSSSKDVNYFRKRSEFLKTVAPEPEPPDRLGRSRSDNLVPTRSTNIERKDNISKLINNFELVTLETKKRKSVRSTEKYSGRSRSEVRCTSSYNEITQRHEPYVSNQTIDVNWPSLDAISQRQPRKKRARSSPRSKPNQQYTPPRDLNESTSTDILKGINQTQKKIQVSKNKANDISSPNKDSSCCICLEKIPDHALYPCGHQCLCSDCKNDFRKRFKECPFCKRAFTDTIKIFKT